MNARMTDWAKGGYEQLLKLMAKQNRCKLNETKVRPLVVYIETFPTNDRGFIDELDSAITELADFIVISDRNMDYPLKFSPQFLNHSFKALITADIVLCDNYVPFLQRQYLNPHAVVIELWHATGAIKCFGYGDPETAKRTLAEQARFHRVYDTIDYFVVGSDKMAEIFEESYEVSANHFLKTGSPRTDIFFDYKRLTMTTETKKKLGLTDRPLIFYTPTYRKTAVTTFPLDVQKMRENFGETHQLVVQLHPHDDDLYRLVEDQLLEDDDFLVINHEPTILPQLLTLTEWLITDYSSVVFEYALANPNGNALFYWYDQEAYEKKVGIQPGFDQELPGPLVHSTNELLLAMTLHTRTDFKDFNAVWNQYNDGHASKRLLTKIKEWLNEID